MTKKIKDFFNNLLADISPENKQRIKLFIIAIIILSILFGVVTFTSNKPKKKPKINKKNLYKLRVIPEDLQRDIEKHRLIYRVKLLRKDQNELEEKVTKISHKLNNIQDSLKKLLRISKNTKELAQKYSSVHKTSKKNKEEIRKLAKITKTLLLLNKKKNSKIKEMLNDNRTFKERIKEKKKKSFYTPINNPELLNIPAKSTKKHNNNEETATIENQKKPKISNVEQNKIYVFTKKENKKKFKTKKVTKTIKIKLAAGSFIQGVLLTGLDAPTAGSFHSNPVPVLIKVEKEAIMPNRFHMDIKGCFIIGAGYGDISTERAMIKTETLSCITNDGKNIDVSLKGHIVDMDGKIGLRGRLVSKTGQILTKSLLTGFLAGISKIFTPQYIPSISVEPDSNALFQTPKMSDVLMSGTLKGASSALKRIADYYIKTAEKIFPVIEIQAGRPIEIMVLRTQTLLTRKKTKIKYVKIKSKAKE